jgi:hypothetical protein
MLKGLRIDNMVIGGPAHNTGLLEKGDTIVAIDGIAVTEESIHAALLGEDIPGSSVVLTIKRPVLPEANFAGMIPDAGGFASAVFRHADSVFNPSGLIRDGSPQGKQNTSEVVVVRMDTATIADRRYMFELFTDMKASSHVAKLNARAGFHTLLS